MARIAKDMEKAEEFHKKKVKTTVMKLAERILDLAELPWADVGAVTRRRVRDLLRDSSTEETEPAEVLARSAAVLDRFHATDAFDADAVLALKRAVRRHVWAKAAELDKELQRYKREEPQRFARLKRLLEAEEAAFAARQLPNGGDTLRDAARADVEALVAKWQKQNDPWSNDWNRFGLRHFVEANEADGDMRDAVEHLKDVVAKAPGAMRQKIRDWAANYVNKVPEEFAAAATEEAYVKALLAYVRQNVKTRQRQLFERLIMEEARGRRR